MTSIAQPVPAPRDRLLDLGDVCRLLGYSRWTLRGLIASNRFPQPLRITGTTGRPRWLMSTVEEWLAGQKEIP